MQKWKSFFIFSDKEKKGIIVLGFILLTSVLIHLAFPGKIKKNESVQKGSIATISLFYFDPNLVDSQQAIQLGFSAKQFYILKNYRNKGGRFKLPADISKLYGLSKEQAASLIDFVRINPTPKSKFLKIDDFKIDMNTATAKQWEQFPFLDARLVRQILNYKMYLGGYLYKNQLQKVFGMNDTIFELLKPHLFVNQDRGNILNSATMNFEQWKKIGLFQDREIWEILRLRKANGGNIGWRALVLKYDLTENQARILKQKIIIND